MLDREHGQFFRILPTGYLSAHKMNSGARTYLLLPALGDQIRRNLLARNGTRLLIAGVERALDPHGRQKPKLSVAEVWDIAEPPRVSAVGLLDSGSPIGELNFPSIQMFAAATPELIVIGTPQGLYLADWSLKVPSVLTGAFEARRFSLDETGRIYMIARVDTRLFFWVLDSQGQLLYSLGLRAAVEESATPPLVGYDHTAYILSGQRVTAISSQGAAKWSYTAPAAIQGAIVTADGRVVVTEANRIVALHANGAPEVLAELEEQLVTAPVLTAGGELLAASSKYLYCLASK
jgi:hypothetical protein